MDSQLTLRIPADLARLLASRARAKGVKRSQLVREALQAYFSVQPAEAPASSVRERIGSYVGAVSLDHAALERDALTRQLRAHNWRK
jgi:hypothetical protein